MNTPLSLHAALAAMQIIKEGSLNGDFQSFGIGEQEFAQLTQSQPWFPSERNSVVRTFDVLTYGVLDAQLLPRFPVPAEYTAAVIACFASPVNIMTACRFLEGGNRAEEVAAGAKQPEQVPAEKLASMVLLILGGAQSVRDAFAKKCGYAIAHATEGVEEHGEVRKAKGKS